MKLLWIFGVLAAVLVIAATITIGCGPQKKYCPNTTTGDCPEPQPDAKGESIFVGGDSIFIESGI